MEDENGIELTLGLSCGRSAGKLKDKDDNPSDIKTEEGGNHTKSMGDLKSLFHTSIHKQDSENVPQRSNHVKPQENFFTSLAKSSMDPDTSTKLHGSTGSQYTRYGESWVANSDKSAEIEEEKTDCNEIGRKLLSGKRKMSFEEISHQKNHKREIQTADSHGKNTHMGANVITSAKTSPIMVSTEDGSTAENEDVAESEAEGSTSRLISHHEDGKIRYMSGGSSFEVPNMSHGLTDLNVMNIRGQNQSNFPPMTHGIPFSLQPYNVMAIPSVSMKVPNTGSAPSASGYPPPGMMQLISPTNYEKPRSLSVSSGNLQLAFGYPPAKLPTLETDPSWAMVSHPQQVPSSYNGRSMSNSTPDLDKSEDGLQKSQAIVQAPEDEVKGNGSNFRPRDASDPLAVEGLLRENSAIRPGIAPGLKFGGCGSYPDLPWVSTTSPNGNTISGVTYKYNTNQVKIVCACHSSHMSPEEFILHASSDIANPENNTGLASFPSNNPEASA